MKETNPIIDISEENGFCLDLRELLNASKKVEEFAKEKGMIEKTEQHITVVRSVMAKDVSSKLRNLAEKIEWDYTAKPEFFYVTKEYDYPNPEKPNEVLKEKRESIIQMIDLIGLEEFYNELNKILSEKPDFPFPHVTLYTNSTRDEKKTRGIGIYSDSGFEKLKPERI